MGKREQSVEKGHKLMLTIPINKSKSLSANLNKLITSLKKKCSDLPTKQYLSLLHKFIARCTQSCKNLSQKMIAQNTYKIRICKSCDEWAIRSGKMVQCIQCQDYYHVKCVPKIENRGDWMCMNCRQLVKKKFDKENYLRRFMENRKKCKKCEVERAKGESMIKCLRCEGLFHENCFGKKHVVCEACDEDIQMSITSRKSMKQLTLEQTMRRKSEKHYRESSQKMQQKDMELDESTKATAFSSDNRRFCQSSISLTSEEIKYYKSKLLYAIMCKNLSYSEELQPQNCQLDDNNEDSLDFALTHLSGADYQTYQRYKEQPIGPYLLEYRQPMGYDVIADKDLPKGLIVCEYVGDVYTHRDVLEHSKDNDSIMELKVGKNADESLMIVPKEHTNIARFINGINNKKGNKPNLSTIRALAQGKPVVLLYTSKKIKKGESLIYDYNAGSNPVGYDTSSFV